LPFLSMPKWVGMFINNIKNQYEHLREKDFKEKYIWI
jgi:hypothetical protein